MVAELPLDTLGQLRLVGFRPSREFCTKAWRSSEGSEGVPCSPMGGLRDLRLFWSVESGMEDVGKRGGQVNVTSVWT